MKKTKEILIADQKKGVDGTKKVSLEAKKKYSYSRVRNKHSPTLIDFLTFFQGLRPYSGLHRGYFIDVLWGQPIKLIQVVPTSEFHEY